jgi:hypothetical protein
MNTFYTYLYRDPSRNNEPIYVGKGKERRAWVHLRRTDKHPFTQRLQKMKRNGIKPVIEFLCKDVDEELSFLCEEEAISLYGRKDLGKGPLLNLSDGGDGPAGYKPSVEHCAKVASAVTLRWNSDNPFRPRRRPKVSKIPKSKKKPCTVDGVTVYESLTALINVLGAGKSGYKSKTFRYL